MTPFILNRWVLFGTWLCTLILVLFPIADYDTYWHLANGREMVNSGRIVGEEIFSYTHAGERFDNHAWLSQIILYLIWDYLGPDGLLSFKLLITSLVVLLLYRTLRLVGAAHGLAAVLCVGAVLAGVHRYTERSELFSLLNITLLSFILYRFRAGLGLRALWFIPAILVLWNSLHGAVYGLLFFSLFVAVENVKHFWPALARGNPLPQNNLSTLNRCFALTLLVMLLDPWGLRSYGIFVEMLAGKGAATTTVAEFSPVSWEPFKTYILLFSWALLLSLYTIRKADITQLLLVLVFGVIALRYNRITAVSAIIIAPVIVSLINTSVQYAQQKLTAKIHAATLVIASVFIVVYGYQIKFREMSPHHFGYSISDSHLPAGAVRFIQAVGLSGPLYNSGQFGGYLAYYLAPERKIFQYNLHQVFEDTYRFPDHPEELDKWNINYAIVGYAIELDALFPAHDWAMVYNDPGTVLVVRRSPQNQALINQYEIRYFNPLMPDEQFYALINNPAIVSRLAEEMGIYLAYRRDDRIAQRWRLLLANRPELLSQPLIQHWVQPALEYNKADSS